MKSYEQRVRALSERLRVSELRALEAWALSWLDEAGRPAAAAPATMQPDVEMRIPVDNPRSENATEPAW